MTTQITLYSEKSEKFEEVKSEMGPDGVELANPQVVIRLIEEYENNDKPDIQGGLTRSQ